MTSTGTEFSFPKTAVIDGKTNDENCFLKAKDDTPDKYWLEYKISLPKILQEKYHLEYLTGSVLNLYPPGGYKHPDYSVIQAREDDLTNWFVKRGLIEPDTKYYTKFKDNFAYLSHMTIPQEKDEHLMRIQTLFLGWTFVHDDVMDNLKDHWSGEFTWEVVERANAVFCDILQDKYGREYTDNFPTDIDFPLFKALAHTWKDFHVMLHTNIPLYSEKNHYFIEYMQDYFNSYVLSHSEKVNGRFSEESAKYWLRLSTGFKPWFELILLIRRVSVSPQMRKDFFLIRLQLASEDANGFINDIFGIAKDLINEEKDTLVMFKHFEKNIPLEEAYQDTVNFLNEQLRDMELLLQILRRRYGTDPMMEEYCFALQDYFDGYMIWCASTRRYFGQTEYWYKTVNKNDNIPE